MSDFFRAGGLVAMLPTLLVGFVMLVSAVLYALRGERRHFSLMLCLGATTLALGALGFCSGVVVCMRYLSEVAADKQLIVAAMGISEAMHNLLLALGLVTIAGLIASLGAALRSPAAAASREAA